MTWEIMLWVLQTPVSMGAVQVQVCTGARMLDVMCNGQVMPPENGICRFIDQVNRSGMSR